MVIQHSGNKMPFQKGNKLAEKENRKDSYLMIRVTPEFKAKVVKASGKKKLSQYILGLIENDNDFMVL